MFYLNKKRNRVRFFTFLTLLGIMGLYLSYIPSVKAGGSHFCRDRRSLELDHIRSLTIDSSGNLYGVEEGGVIVKITSTGLYSIIAGQKDVNGHQDGPGVSAQFWKPNGIAIDSNSNLYVADTFNHVIRKITPAGDVSTIAGTPQQRGFQDGKGLNAKFYYPKGLAIHQDNLFIADSSNHVVRKIDLTDPAYTVKTEVGYPKHAGNRDGPNTFALLNQPEGVTVDPNRGVLYITDHSSDSNLSLFGAGSIRANDFLLYTLLRGHNSFLGNEDLKGLQVSRFNDIYAVDFGNHVIKKISTSRAPATSTIIAGDHWGYADGIGRKALFINPTSIVMDERGQLPKIYVSDNDGTRIRIITTTLDPNYDFNYVYEVGTLSICKWNPNSEF